MVARPIAFGTQLASHDHKTFSTELAENLLVEPAPEGAKHPYVLVGLPGLTLFATCGDGPVRGIHLMQSRLFVVSGQEVYHVDSSGCANLIGTIPGAGPVSMDDNGSHVWVATGDGLYAVDTTSISLVANGEWITSVAYQDGYLIGVEATSQNMYISGIDDALTVSALDVTTVDSLPGNNVAIISKNREPLVLKESSIEAFYNSGDAAFPFQRTQVVEVGCGAARSVAKDTNVGVWLAADNNVYQMSGYQPVSISPPNIVALIEDQPDKRSAEGWIYQFRGHKIYNLTFANLTLGYDFSTQRWHKRSSYGLNRWRVTAGTWAVRWRKYLAGDYENGNIYALDAKTYDENGEPMLRRPISQPLWNGGRRFVIDYFGLDVDAGHGLVTGQGSDPQAMLELSDDGGRTWYGELWRSIGKMGEYDMAVEWRGLGAHRNCCIRVTISDPVPVRIGGAYVELTPLA